MVHFASGNKLAAGRKRLRRPRGVGVSLVSTGFMLADDGIAAQATAEFGGNERARSPSGMQPLELFDTLIIPDTIVRIGHGDCSVCLLWEAQR
jgi:hypothetical protein